MQFLLILLMASVALVVLGLVIAFVLVPLMKGIGWLIMNLFRGIGWLIVHVFEFVGGMISDVLRLIGSLLVILLLLPFPPVSVVLGRWSAAGHYAESLRRECAVAGLCLYRLLLRRPLKLLMLHGVLEGVEHRLPEAMAAAPTSDKPSHRAGQFEGYTIVGSLPAGGSGAKLYVAEPAEDKRARVPGMPDRVVVKSFALSEGSSLPQIVRESRALECAKQLGHVLDHGMDEHRFFYVMPYHPGEHLGVITRQLHGKSDGRGLDERQMRTLMSYVDDLLQTLSHYHRGGLWHKDVKPENVIVHDGRAHLVDLGLVTPLRSAMTLTTHGTEYFRDPEMVRQALRGVKVHQVDGGKFDVYAVGAVLYFMAENTFPAHGGLSSFSKRSPEALRWIIRRAMADYNKRYTSADEMLADLRAIRGAENLMAIRPADLPSMGGAVAASFVTPTPVDRVASAGSPVPPAPVAADFGSATPEPTESRRPRLRVTNWWTGAYAVEDAAAAAGAAGEAARKASSFRQEAQALRWESREIKRRVKKGTMGARRAAKEQIRAARTRARDLQRRATTRRHRAVAERQPSAALILAVLVFIGITAFSAVAVFMLASRQPSWRHGHTVVVESSGRSGGASAVAVGSTADSDPVMIVVDVPNRHEPPVTGQIKKIMSARLDEGFEVILPKSDAEHDQYAALIRDWRETGPEGPTTDALDDLFEQLGIEGMVYVSPHIDARGDLELRETIVRLPEATAADELAVFPESLLLINDHPAKANQLVKDSIEHLVDQYEANSCQIVVDDEAEAAVRPLLPTRPVEHGESPVLPARFQSVLAELSYDGVLWVTARPGDGDPHERLLAVRLDALPAEAPIH